MIKAMMVKSVYALAAIGILAAACTTSIGALAISGPAQMESMSATPAATLRTTLDALLGEHVILAAAATGAALDGRDAEFTAAVSALDGNSVDIEGDRLRVRGRRRAGVPAAMASSHRLRRGLHNRCRHERCRQAGAGRSRSLPTRRTSAHWAPAKAFSELRMAAAHMQMIATPSPKSSSRNLPTGSWPD